MVEKLLNLKVSSGTLTILVGSLALVAFLIVRYFASRDGAATLTSNQSDPFWERNPHLEFVDRFPRTAFRIARDRAENRTFFIDLSRISSDVVRISACGTHDPELVLTGAIDLVCLDIVPLDGVGTPFVGGVSFTSQAKQAQVAQFFRGVFDKRGQKVSVMEDSSRGTILEGEDAHGDTVTHVAIQESFGTARVFVCWVKPE